MTIKVSPVNYIPLRGQVQYGMYVYHHFSWKFRLCPVQIQVLADRCIRPSQAVYKIRDSAMPNSISARFRTVKIDNNHIKMSLDRLGLAKPRPNPCIGLNKPPYDTKNKIFLHSFSPHILVPHCFNS